MKIVYYRVLKLLKQEDESEESVPLSTFNLEDVK
jgi:hypothetical protein